MFFNHFQLHTSYNDSLTQIVVDYHDIIDLVFQIHPNMIYSKPEIVKL